MGACPKMAAIRRSVGLALTAALGCSVAGCSSSPASRSSTTTSEPSTSTSVPPASTTTTATPASTQHVEYGGVTPVTVTYDPDSGPPGTHVQVTGSGFVGQSGQIAQNDAYRFNLLIELSACELIGAPTDAMVSVSPSGGLSGSFTVPSTGGCFQQMVTKPLSPGQYQMLLGAHTANLGTFTVTSP